MTKFMFSAIANISIFLLLTRILPNSILLIGAVILFRMGILLLNMRNTLLKINRTYKVWMLDIDVHIFTEDGIQYIVIPNECKEMVES